MRKENLETRSLIALGEPLVKFFLAIADFEGA
jgi:hypothetical protein